jgi:hypothetical protein
MSSAALKGCHEVQNLGAVQTYLRRYLWVAALEIVEHDALDSSKPLSDEPKFSINDSIRVLKSAPNLEALTAYFKVEVAKYPAKTPDYMTLKAEATAQRKYLEEMAVAA